MNQREEAERDLTAALQEYRLALGLRRLVKEQAAAAIAREIEQGKSISWVADRLGMFQVNAENLLSGKRAERVALSLDSLAESLPYSLGLVRDTRARAAAAMAQAWRAGVSVGSMAKQSGLTRPTVYKMLKEAGVEVGQEPAELAGAREGSKA